MNKKALDGEFYKTYHSEGWEDPDLLELTTTDENEGFYVIRQSSEIKDPPVCPWCLTSECFRATERHGWDKYYCDRILTRYFDLKVPYRDIFYLKRCTTNPEHMYLLNQRITKGFLLDDEFHFRCQFCDSPDLQFKDVFKSPRIYWGNLWAKCYSQYSCNTCGQYTIVIKRSDLVVSANTLYRKLKPIEREIIGETKVIEGIAPEIERIVTQVFDSKTFEIIEKIRKESSLAYSKKIKSKEQKAKIEKAELGLGEKIPLYFITDYKVAIKPGPKREGILTINNKKIKISSIESDLCIVMAKQLHEDWKYISERDPMDVGWVSFEEFENEVSRWIILKEKKGVVSDSVVINAINRLNKKIRKTLRFKKKFRDLIENGAFYGRAKCYRFRVYPKMIKIED